MNTALLSLALALSMIGPQDEGVVETRWPGGGLRERYEVDEAGAKHGEFVQFREDGSVAVTARYRGGKRQGRYAELGEEGELLLEAMYERGERSGYWRTYEDGVRTLSATYRKGVLDGRWEREEVDRSHRVKATYRRGVLDGRFTESRPEERWERSATYKKGELDGAAKIKVGNKVVSRRKWERGFSGSAGRAHAVPAPAQRADRGTRGGSSGRQRRSAGPHLRGPAARAHAAQGVSRALRLALAHDHLGREVERPLRRGQRGLPGQR